jgi:hypothetical protein
MAEYLIREIADRFPDIHIEMDTNPVLYAELRRQTKKQKLQMKYGAFVLSLSFITRPYADSFPLALPSAPLSPPSLALTQTLPFVSP